ncbi:MAG: hypothetical protein SOZ56_09705 [Oscillospiraceae bacterium]|nr:hypothetical protein [Oscillospiraceae bacterium]
MDKLIEILPTYIFFIVLGFIFLRIFRHMCSIKNSDEYEHIIWESLLWGFVLYKCFSAIPFSINKTIDSLGMTVSTIILSTVCAKIYSNRFIDTMLRKLGIYRTRHKYIWQDLEDKENVTYINVINPETNEAYYGALKYYEDFERYPQIVLQYYKYWEDWHIKQPTLDFSNQPEYVVMVDTKVFSKINVMYNKNSEKVKNKDDTP